MSDGSRRSQIAHALTAFEVREAPCAQGFRAAVAIALINDGPQLSFWLTLRAPRLRAHAGQFALPGGRCDAGEDAAEAALRELHEELGVAVDPGQVLGRLDDYPTRSGYVVTPVVVWVGDDVPAVEANADEVAQVFEVAVAELAAPPRFISIAESPRPVIQLPLLGQLIHAPTGAILHQFHEVAVAGRPTRVHELEQPVFAWR